MFQICIHVIRRYYVCYLCKRTERLSQVEDSVVNKQRRKQLLKTQIGYLVKPVRQLVHLHLLRVTGTTPYNIVELSPIVIYIRDIDIVISSYHSNFEWPFEIQNANRAFQINQTQNIIESGGLNKISTYFNEAPSSSISLLSVYITTPMCLVHHTNLLGRLNSTIVQI